MKDKIFQALKQTYSAKYGVGDEILQGIAESLANTGLITDANLATVVQGQETQLRAHQSRFDRVNTENLNYKKQIDELTKKPTEDTPKALTAEEIAKIAATAAAEAVKPLGDKLTTLETQTVAEKRNADIMSKAKEYSIPESFVNKFNIPTDVNLDTYFKGVQQEFVNIGFSGVKTPEGGVGIVKENEAIANMITEDTKKIVESKK